MDELHDHLVDTERRLAEEKGAILRASPLAGPCQREAYAFAYVRAERAGVKALTQSLAALNGLPLQLDVHPEMMGKNREPIKRWIKTGKDKADAGDFGNDFMHALTRVAVQDGWTSPAFHHLSSRIVQLFCELACLINAAYFCSWLSENQVESVELTAPGDLHQTVMELAALMRSPDFIKHMRARKKAEEKRDAPPKSNGKYPNLHVIQPRDGDSPDGKRP
jgi:hypothetical protein